MTVNELKRLAGQVQVATEAHSVEERMGKPATLAKEVPKVGIMVAQDVDGFHLRQPVKKPNALCQNLADVALPQLEQVTTDYELTVVVVHEIEERQSCFSRSP